MENPVRETKALFDVMGIDHGHVDAALSALERDSQNKIFGARGVKDESAYPPELWVKLDRVYAALGLPLRHDTSVEEFKKIICGGNEK